MNYTTYVCGFLVFASFQANAMVQHTLDREVLVRANETAASIAERKSAIVREALNTSTEKLKEVVIRIFSGFTQELWVDIFSIIMLQTNRQEEIRMALIVGALTVKRETMSSNTVRSFIEFFNDNARLLESNNIRVFKDLLENHFVTLASKRGSLPGIITPQKRLSREISASRLKPPVGQTTPSKSAEELAAEATLAEKFEQTRSKQVELADKQKKYEIAGLENLLQKVNGLDDKMQGVIVTLKKTTQAQEMLRLAEQAYSEKKYPEAFTYLSAMTKQNENKMVKAWACYRIGELYMYGRGVKQSYDTAGEHFRIAIEQSDNDEAKKNAEELLKKIKSECNVEDKQERFQGAKKAYSGEGEKKDFKKAIALFEPFTRQEDDKLKQIEAYVFLGEIYFAGFHGVMKDLEKSYEFFEKASTIPLPTVMGENAGLYQEARICLKWAALRKAQIAYSQGNYSTAFNNFSELLQVTRSAWEKEIAQTFIGSMCLKGQHVEVDHLKALSLFKELLADEVPKSRKIGEELRAVVVLSDEAKSPLKIEIEREHKVARAWAQTYLGEMNYNGQGLQKPDYYKAKELLLEASKQEYSMEAKEHAQRILGAMAVGAVLPAKKKERTWATLWGLI